MKIAIIGKGAPGLLFGSIAREHLGTENVCFVMDDARYVQRKDDIFTIRAEIASLG